MLDRLDHATQSRGLTTGELITAMAQQGLWQSPGGKTPAATLYAAITREISQRGAAARFCKLGPGRFGPTAAATPTNTAASSSVSRAAVPTPRPRRAAVPTRATRAASTAAPAPRTVSTPTPRANGTR